MWLPCGCHVALLLLLWNMYCICHHYNGFSFLSLGSSRSSASAFSALATFVVAGVGSSRNDLANIYRCSFIMFGSNDTWVMANNMQHPLTDVCIELPLIEHTPRRLGQGRVVCPVERAANEEHGTPKVWAVVDGMPWTMSILRLVSHRLWIDDIRMLTLAGIDINTSRDVTEQNRRLISHCVNRLVYQMQMAIPTKWWQVVCFVGTIFTKHYQQNQTTKKIWTPIIWLLPTRIQYQRVPCSLRK